MQEAQKNQKSSYYETHLSLEDILRMIVINVAKSISNHLIAPLLNCFYSNNSRNSGEVLYLSHAIKVKYRHRQCFVLVKLYRK